MMRAGGSFGGGGRGRGGGRGDQAMWSRGGGRGGRGGGGGGPIRDPPEPFRPGIVTYTPSNEQVQVDPSVLKDHQAVELSTIRDSDQRLYPLRPSIGIRGEPTDVLCTGFRTEIDEEAVIHIYGLDIIQGARGPLPWQVQKQVLEECLLVLAGELGPPKLPMLLDDAQWLITNDKSRIGDMRVLHLHMPDDRGNWVHYKVGVAHKRELRLGEWATNPKVMKALNIILTHGAHKLYEEVGQARFFDPSQGVPIRNGTLLACKGFAQSLRASQAGVVLNVDQSVAPLVRGQPLGDFILSILNVDKLPSKFSDRQRRQVTRVINKLKVELTRFPGVEYTITGMSKEPPGNIPARRSGKEIKNIAQYWESNNKEPLKHLDLQCLKVGNRENWSYLPIEECKLVEGQMMPHAMSDDVSGDMIKLAAVKPSNRFNRVYDKVVEIVESVGPLCSEFGLTLTREALQLRARILDGPQLMTKGPQGPHIEQVKGGRWDMSRKVFFEPALLELWAVLNFVPPTRASSSQVEAFVQQLGHAMVRRGMYVASEPVTILSAHNRDPEEAIEEVIEGLGGEKPQLFVCILAGESHLYNDIKRAAEVELGVMTQCLTLKQVLGTKEVNLCNIALKINEKLGGTNSLVADPVVEYFASHRVMVMGGEVEINRTDAVKPSYASLAGSYDAGARKHMVVLKGQKPKHHVLTDIEDMVTRLLHKYESVNGHLPDRVLFYRGNLYENHYKDTMIHESQEIKSACNRLKEGYSPLLTYVVVDENHNQRFFTRDPRVTDRSGNAPCGLVVDVGICDPKHHDFYLLSHCGIQGTSTPSHYHVLRDEAGMPSDDLQQLTFFLCHNYARASMSVSTPPSLYYSRLANRRACSFLEHDIPDDVSVVSGRTNASTRTTAAQVSDWGALLCDVKDPLASEMWFI